MLPSEQDAPGDSVTDALTWATHWPPPAHLADPNAHPELWEPFAEQILLPGADVDATADRLRAAGWDALAEALTRVNAGAEPTGNLDPIDRAVLALLRRP